MSESVNQSGITGRHTQETNVLSESTGKGYMKTQFITGVSTILFITLLSGAQKSNNNDSSSSAVPPPAAVPSANPQSEGSIYDDPFAPKKKYSSKTNDNTENRKEVTGAAEKKDESIKGSIYDDPFAPKTKFSSETKNNSEIRKEATSAAAKKDETIKGSIYDDPFAPKKRITSEAQTSSGNVNDALTAGTVKDFDGNEYKTITIGTQVWMQSNLRVLHYQNGDPVINGVKSDFWGSSSIGMYCDYDNNPSNSRISGRLYNYYCIKDPRKLSPPGWHIPTKAEWIVLMDYLGGFKIAGGKMKEVGTSHWESPNIGAANSSGFTGIPGGFRSTDKDVESSTCGIFFFESWKSSGTFWSSSKTSDDKHIWVYRLTNESNELKPYANTKMYDGFSVRCIKD